MIDIEERLQFHGFYLPLMPKANGAYQTWTIDNGLFLTSGQLSRDKGQVIKGPISSDLDLSKAHKAATVAILRCLSLFSQAQDQGALFERVVSLKGYVSSTSSFSQQSQVLDTASDILLQIFGDEGKHVRTAIGVSCLPSEGLIELELTIRCKS